MASPPQGWCFGAPGSSPSSLRVCSSCLGPAALRRLAEACGDGKEPSHRRVPGLEAGQVQEALSEGSGLEVLGCFGSCQGLCLLPEAAGLSHGTNCSLWEETSSPSVAPEPGSPKTGATGASCESSARPTRFRPISAQAAAECTFKASSKVPPRRVCARSFRMASTRGAEL